MNQSAIDTLLVYTLAKAGEAEDYRERTLGPIHLIKYVYLADLAYAEENEGRTFTGLDWQFFRFGPWCPALYDRIPTVLAAAGATSYSFPSDFKDDDYTRWALREPEITRTTERQIGIHMAGLIARLVERFANFTPELLDFVYKTPPMLRAAPLERLDFTPSGWRYRDTTPFKTREAAQPMTRKQEKKLEEWTFKVQQGVQARINALKENQKQEKLSACTTVYDEVFFQGVEALNTSSALELSEGKLTAKFHPDIWKSRVRHDPDLPD